jgi:hypothetical protein
MEMEMSGTSVTVSALPTCDFCGGTAAYDGKTKMGPWGFMCKMDFARYGVGLGLGKGQKLVVA